MANTRTSLSECAANLDESMGVRHRDSKPQLSPVASAKDIGRVPLRDFGRLKVDRISTDPNQPRDEVDEEEIQRLARSIRKTGQLHPIRVRWNPALRKWIIVTGERRYRAALVAGLDRIDCYFHEDEITDSEILQQQLVENLLREDLKPLEEARGYAALMKLNGFSGKQVAESLHVSPSKVSRALALLELPKEVQAQIRSGQLPRTAAYELTKLDSESVQQALVDQSAVGLLTQRQAAKVVRQRKGKPAAKARPLRQTFLAENGVKVTVTARSKASYHDLKQALEEALDEVRLRIDNNIALY